MMPRRSPIGSALVTSSTSSAPSSAVVVMRLRRNGTRSTTSSSSSSIGAARSTITSRRPSPRRAPPRHDGRTHLRPELGSREPHEHGAARRDRPGEQLWSTARPTLRREARRLRHRRRFVEARAAARPRPTRPSPSTRSTSTCRAAPASTARCTATVVRPGDAGRTPPRRSSAPVRVGRPGRWHSRDGESRECRGRCGEAAWARSSALVSDASRYAVQPRSSGVRVLARLQPRRPSTPWSVQGADEVAVQPRSRRRCTATRGLIAQRDAEELTVIDAPAHELDAELPALQSPHERGFPTVLHRRT